MSQRGQDVPVECGGDTCQHDDSEHDLIVLQRVAEELELGQEEVWAVDVGEDVNDHRHDLALSDINRSQIETAAVVLLPLRHVERH